MKHGQGDIKPEARKVSAVEAEFIGVIKMFRDMGFSDSEIAEVFNGKPKTQETEQKGSTSEKRQG